MTGEEMERAIEFLLQGQANFDARLGQLLQGQANFDARQANFDARLDQLLQNQANFEIRLEQTNQHVAETSRQLQAYAETQTEFIQIVTTAMQGLAASQSRTDERLAAAQSRMDERFVVIDKHLMQTDERLNKLAGLVERIISEGRNGHA
jgi:chromosome segregation ATPase